MTSEELWRRHPEERPAGSPALTEDEAAELDGQISAAWAREGTGGLRREFGFASFAPAFALATRIALLAEREQHHPVLEVAWGRLVVTFTTDSVGGGLTGNDYIMAAKVDRLAEP